VSILPHGVVGKRDARVSARVAIGVDLGGTKLLVGAVDTEQRVLHRGQEPSHGRTGEEVLAVLEREVRETYAARPDAIAVGLGIPATIDRRRGIAVNAVNLPLVDVPVDELIGEEFPIPVYVDNDANCAALAEYLHGAGKGTTNMILLTIGTGIGGGMILDRKLYRGSTGAGAELGHVVIDLDGPRCQGNCPNHGCVEAMASGTALAREGRAAGEREPDSALGRMVATGEEVTGRAVTAAAIAGDPVAVEVMALIGRRIGVALSSFANIFDPDLIVIGGGVSAAGELLIEPARQELRSRALPPMNEVRVVKAELGSDAGMIGAAAMALRELEGDGPGH
jgi:glucokinase